MNEYEETATIIEDDPGSTATILPVETTEKSPVVGYQSASNLPAVDIDRLLTIGAESGNIDTLERLMKLRQQLLAEHAKKEYTRCMSEFQKRCPKIIKTKPVRTKEGKIAFYYAPLDEIVKQTKDLIFELGFTYNWKSKEENGKLIVVCVVTHSAGHEKEFDFPVPILAGNKLMNIVQATASSITYGRRHSLCGAFGIVTESTDMDGQIYHDMEVQGQTGQTGGNTGGTRGSSGGNSFKDAPEENKGMYQSIMALLREKESGTDLFPAKDKREIKHTADTLLMDHKALVDYYKAINTRAQKIRAQIKQR